MVMENKYIRVLCMLVNDQLIIIMGELSTLGLYSKWIFMPLCQKRPRVKVQFTATGEGRTELS